MNQSPWPWQPKERNLQAKICVFLTRFGGGASGGETDLLVFRLDRLSPWTIPKTWNISHKDSHQLMVTKTKGKPATENKGNFAPSFQYQFKLNYPSRCGHLLCRRCQSLRTLIANMSMNSDSRFSTCPELEIGKNWWNKHLVIAIFLVTIDAEMASTKRPTWVLSFFFFFFCYDFLTHKKKKSSFTVNMSVRERRRTEWVVEIGEALWTNTDLREVSGVLSPFLFDREWGRGEVVFFNWFYIILSIKWHQRYIWICRSVFTPIDGRKGRLTKHSQSWLWSVAERGPRIPSNWRCDTRPSEKG